MSEPFAKPIEALKSFTPGLTGSATLATLVLYIQGYISLRFHLTTFGVPADLEIVDERYVFHGAQFLVFFLSLLPSFLVVLLAAALAVRALGWVLGHLAPKAIRRPSIRLLERAYRWLSRPALLFGLSSVVSLLMIQKVMRLCFEFHDLLLARNLGGSRLLRAVMQDQDGLDTGIYFVLLLAGITLPAALWWRGSRLAAGGGRWSVLQVVSAVLILLQMLLLPANYGVLVADKGVLKVNSVPTRPAPLKETEAAWLVWRGKEWCTYLIRDTAQRRDDRLLLSVRSSDVKTIDASAYDRILSVLFLPPGRQGGVQ